MPAQGAPVDVLVVGGGIGGATIALALGRRGWRVCVLEREPSPPRITRPEVLAEATLREIERLDVGPALREQASLPIHGFELRHGGEVLLQVTAADLEAANAAPYSTEPGTTRQWILDAALGTGNVQLFRGATVTEVSHASAVAPHEVADAGRHIVRGERGDAPFEIAARLLVGDDGVHSVVREALRIPLETALFPLEFITWTMPLPPELSLDRMHGWINPRALRAGSTATLVAPWPAGRACALVGAPLGSWESRYQAAPRRFWEDLRALTPHAHWIEERLRFPEDFSRVRRPYGHAPTYVADGAALIGDAAHPMSPVGGQGANAAIWDALALAGVADAALAAGDLGAERLTEYERRRRPANARSLEFTLRAVRAVELARKLPGAGWLLPGMLRRADRDIATKRRLLHEAATAFTGER